MKKRLLIFGVAGLVVILVASACLAEVEFSVGGHFRALSYWITNPDLVKGGPERSYTEQMLILNPVLKISDSIHIKTRLRALDYIWGDNYVGGPAGGGGLTWGLMGRAEQGDGGTNNFQWDRAWVHIFLGKYGSLQIGRQQTDLFHNYSIAEDDTYPRYHYITPVFNPAPDQNLMFGFFYDKRAEGDIDVGGATDAFAWCPWAFFWNPQVTIGAGLFAWNFAGIGPAGESSTWNQLFVMINTKLGPVDIKSEGDIFFGKALPWLAPWADYKHNLQFFVDASVPVEASPFVDKVAVVVGLFQGTTESVTDFTGSLGSNEDWVDEWKIDLILWDQIYNQIYNAFIIRPKIDFVVPDTKWGGFLSACMSFADQEAQYNPGPLPLTAGTEKSIGTEIDLGINYTVGPRQTIELVVGMLMPGKYFDEANRDTTIGAALKTHIRF